jgi:hypothetical protein
VAHWSIPDTEVAQAAATLAAGALRSIDTREIPEAEKLGDYALDVFWHVYEAMRVGVETVPLEEAAVAPGER